LCACFTRLSGRFPSVLRFRLYQILSALIFAGAVRPFGFSAVPTLPDPLGVSGPLLERGWPSCFRFPAFPTLSDPIRCRFRSEFVSDYPSEGFAFRLARILSETFPPKESVEVSAK
ncbi:hypothetical protein, partial [Streptomyces sp. NPDC059080]|uniref:hypothetical protein n=1 Tax=Streptomyces sp. NPDC059080 TaxID=3346718 RepID=UPI0036BE576D